MKTFCIVFTALLFLALQPAHQPAHAQTQEEIDEALRYYPLEVGNYWEYRRILGAGQIGSEIDTVYHSIKITADSTLANGITYKIMQSVNQPYNIFFAHHEFDVFRNAANQRVASYLERVDEEKATVYQWKPEDDQPFNEVLIDSLLLPPIPVSEYPSIHINAARWPDVENTIYYGISTGELFGMEVMSINFDISFIEPIGYSLTKDLGLSSFQNYQLIYFRDHLGNEYGDSVLVSTPEEPELPQAATLSQNYPNPFNPGTQIDYALPEASEVRIEVFNLMGQRVAELVNQRQTAGNYTVAFNAGKLASGVYLYRLTTGNTTITQKMTLVK